MNSNYYYDYYFVCVNSLTTFSSFFFRLSRFFLTAIDLLGTLGLFGRHLAATSIWAITKFSNSSFGISISHVS